MIKTWTTPKMTTISLRAAEGHRAGPLCDKYGSLSATLGNDRCGPRGK